MRGPPTISKPRTSAGKSGRECPRGLTALLAAALAAAAIEDAIRLRISNATCLVVLVAAIVTMALHGFPLALWQNLVVFLVLLALGTLVFATGQVGGGDVKLLACLGLWVNLSAAPWLVASIFLAGGLIALVYLAVGVVRRLRRRDDDNRTHRPDPDPLWTCDRCRSRAGFRWPAWSHGVQARTAPAIAHRRAALNRCVGWRVMRQSPGERSC